MVAESHRFVGPIPPADDLAKYQRIQQDLPERIMRLAEEEQAFRHRYLSSLSMRAQLLVPLIALAGIGASVAIAIWGNAPGSAAFIAVGSIVGAVTTTVWGYTRKKA